MKQVQACTEHSPDFKPNPADFARELERMKQMQQRQELPPDEVEEMRKAEPVLLDDAALQGIGFKSFEI